MAAKRTSDLIPLCHPLPLTRVALDLTVEATAVTANATCATDAKTGVEMEALTATSIALLTIYDMAKALDKNMTIEGVRLLRSEEHTSELQSLMRISYAVFCLKKQKKQFKHELMLTTNTHYTKT